MRGSSTASNPLAIQFLRIVPQNPYGGVAQLGEHLPCKQGVKGSIPFISTSDNRESVAKDEHESVTTERITVCSSGG